MLDIKAIDLLHKLKGTLNLSDLQEMLSLAQAQSFPAQTQIIPYGSKNRKVYFIQKGLVRSFFVDNIGGGRRNAG